MPPLLYSNNADIKYPLSDFHTGDVPNGALLDISLSLPPGMSPVVGAFRIGSGFVFISVEQAGTREAIATAIVHAPIPARVYPMDMHVQGFGWVVFGPSVTGDPYYSGNIEIELDPETYTALAITGLELRLGINGFDKQVSNVLELAAGSDLIEVSVEDGVIYLDRADDTLTEDGLSGLTAQAEGTNDVPILYTVDGTPPDATGNLDIVVVGCVSGCKDVRSLSIPRGDTGLGEGEELPLDIFDARTFEPGDPCGPDDESSAEDVSADAVDPFDGCTPVVAVDILDASDNDRPIGSLYTVPDAV